MKNLDSQFIIAGIKPEPSQSPRITSTPCKSIRFRLDFLLKLSIFSYMSHKAQLDAIIATITKNRVDEDAAIAEVKARFLAEREAARKEYRKIYFAFNDKAIALIKEQGVSTGNTEASGHTHVLTFTDSPTFKYSDGTEYKILSASVYLSGISNKERIVWKSTETGRFIWKDAEVLSIEGFDLWFKEKYGF